MAESARQLNNQGSEPEKDFYTGPQRTPIQGGGEGGGPSSRGQLSEVPEPDEEQPDENTPGPPLASTSERGAPAHTGSLAAAPEPVYDKDKAPDSGDAPSRDDLRASETKPSQTKKQKPGNQERSLYKPSGGNSRGRRQSGQNKGFLGRFSGRQKLIGLGGGLVGGGIIALVLLLLPALRLESYLAGINERVFAAANNAVANRVSHLFENYMVKRVTGIQKCGNLVTASCRANYASSGIAGNLYNAWRDAKIEDKFFQQYGFEIESYKNPVDGKERFKIIDKAGRFGDPGAELTIKEGKLKLGKFEGGPRILGREWNKFLINETEWDKVLQRRSLRKFLVRKHGVKFWCFFACKTKDAIDNSKLSATTKLKLKLIERTVMPFSKKYALIMKCLTTGKGSLCSPDNLDKAGLDRSTLSKQDLADLQKFEKNPNLRLSQFLIEKLLVNAGLDPATAKGVIGLVPYAGQTYLALTALSMLDHTKNFITSGQLSKIAAEVNSSQYVEYYADMRKANDEMKAGVLSANEVGALNDQFNDGGQPAEQSLVYQAYNGGGVNTGTTASIFSDVAYAVSAQTSSQKQYLCSNGQPIPSGQYVCPEKTLNNRTFTVEKYFNNSKDLISVLNLYDKCWGLSTPAGCTGVRVSSLVDSALSSVNFIINNTLGRAIGALLKPASLVPGVSNFLNLVKNETGKLFNYIFQQAFPLPFQPGSSPGRDRYDALEAGGEITASQFNQGGYTADGQPYGLGGQHLNAQQQAVASQAFLDQENYDNAHSSVLNRIANIDNPSSLLSRFVAIMPSTWGEFSSGVARMFSNPFHSLGVIWHPAHAAPAPDINAFGVVRNGYIANDSVFSADPSKYTPQYCAQQKKKWEASKIQAPGSGVDEYTTTDPCLLEQVSVEAASSFFTQNDSLSQ